MSPPIAAHFNDFFRFDHVHHFRGIHILQVSEAGQHIFRAQKSEQAHMHGRRCHETFYGYFNVLGVRITGRGYCPFSLENISQSIALPTERIDNIDKFEVIEIPDSKPLCVVNAGSGKLCGRVGGRRLLFPLLVRRGTSLNEKGQENEQAGYSGHN
ncbi:hypothetical protein [Dyadobacter sp. 676]|uniref:AraC family transcriptional regulator n=1 Tax=Dyadobacter sp. 676 TaxID=3088362 RepID=A0AAU8FBR1_9BACT